MINTAYRHYDLPATTAANSTQREMFTKEELQQMPAGRPEAVDTLSCQIREQERMNAHPTFRDMPEVSRNLFAQTFGN